MQTIMIPDIAKMQTTIIPLMNRKLSKNNVAEILKSKGMEGVRPTDTLLEELGINRTRFYRLINNQVKMNPLERKAFAKWLNVDDKLIITLEL